MIKSIATVGLVLFGMLFASNASAGYINDHWSGHKANSHWQSSSAGKFTKSFGGMQKAMSKIKGIMKKAIVVIHKIKVHKHNNRNHKQVPEPGTLWLIALGVLGLGVARRRLQAT